MGPKLGLEIRPGDARPEGGEATHLVEVEELRHSAEIDRQHRRSPWLGVDVADDAGAATPGNDGDSRLLCPGEQGADMRWRLWVGDGVGDRRHEASAQGDPVGEALATGVPQPILRVHRVQGPGGQAAQGELGQRRGELGVGVAGARPDPLGEGEARPLGH